MICGVGRMGKTEDDTGDVICDAWLGVGGLVAPGVVFLDLAPFLEIFRTTSLHSNPLSTQRLQGRSPEQAL